MYTEPEVVKGVLRGFSEFGEFTYFYTCVLCDVKFVESAPELSVPALCHSCYTGRVGCNRDERKTVKARNQGKIKRIYK